MLLLVLFVFLCLAVYGLLTWGNRQQGADQVGRYDDYVDYRRNGGQPPC